MGYPLPEGCGLDSFIDETVLRHVEVIIDPFSDKKFTVGPGFGDDAVIDHHDPVTIPDGGEAVGDDERGPALQQGFDALLDEFLRLGIDV